MEEWAIFHIPQDSNTVNTFLKDLVRSASNMNMKIKNPIKVVVSKSSIELFVAKVNDIVQNNSNIQLVVIVFYSLRKDYYNAIKRLCCVQLGIPSQVIEYALILIVVIIINSIMF